MSLIPPLSRVATAHLPDIATSYGNKVRFRAPCPCGEGDSWWVATRAETAQSQPQYDIRCKHTEESHV